MKNKTKRRIDKKAAVWTGLIACKVFHKYYYNGDLSLTCSKITLYAGVIKKLIEWHQLESDRISKEYKMTKLPEDKRTGRETYGYASIESIETKLSYISDRFGAAFRLRWLLDVPKEVHKLKNKIEG